MPIVNASLPRCPPVSYLWDLTDLRCTSTCSRTLVATLSADRGRSGVGWGWGMPNVKRCVTYTRNHAIEAKQSVMDGVVAKEQDYYVCFSL